MFINISNHPTAKWGEKQLAAAHELNQSIDPNGQASTIVDIPFPNVRATADNTDIEILAFNLFHPILETYRSRETVVHVMGEMSLTYALVRRFLTHGFMAVASTTERTVVENPDGTKLTTFNFVQFRHY